MASSSTTSPQRSVASVDDDTPPVSSGTPQFEVPETLHSRCMRVLRWDDGFTTRAIRGYRQFMGLKIRLEDWDATKMVPPPIIEQVWQQHILDVNHYAQACPRRLHYNPDDRYGSDQYTSRVRATELALEGTLSGEVDPEIWSFAPRDLTHNNNDSSSTDDEPDEQQQQHQRSNKRRRRSSSTREPRRTDAITFFVRWAQNNNHQRPNDLYFKIRPTTPMARVFERFNMHWATNGAAGDEEDFTFFFGGRMVRPTDTANSIGLVSDDMMNATRADCVLE